MDIIYDSGKIRMSAILSAVIIILLLCVGFGVYSQKKTVKPRVDLTPSSPSTRLHKIAPPPEPALTEGATASSTAEEVEPETIGAQETTSMTQDEGAAETTSDQADSENAIIAKTNLGAVADMEPDLQPSASMDADISNEIKPSADQPADSPTPSAIEPTTEKSPSTAVAITDRDDHVSAPADFFSIQVGAYRSAKNADHQTGELRRAGYDAVTVQSADDGGRPWYFVRFGRFGDKVRAREALEAYRRDHDARAIMIHSDRP